MRFENYCIFADVFHDQETLQETLKKSASFRRSQGND